MSRPPNILITGTPGVGKTTTAEAVATALGLAHVDIGKAITEQELHSGWDDEFECNIVDEAAEDRVRAPRGHATPGALQPTLTRRLRRPPRRCATRSRRR